MKVHGNHLSLATKASLDWQILLGSARLAAEQRAVMSHHTDNMIDPYLGHTVTLDTQSLYFDMPLQKDLVKRAVGIAAHRDL